jgi:hypothetical protein
MCKICDNEYGGLQTLNIKYCKNIKEIPNIEGLQRLTITYCENIKEIPHIEGLQRLEIDYEDVNMNEYYASKKTKKKTIKFT